MLGEIQPIGRHEGVELAAITSYYMGRNLDALRLLDQRDQFPAFEDADGRSTMHYETMVIRSVERLSGPDIDARQVRLFPALPINGSGAEVELSPIDVTLLEQTDVRGGFIALIQRMNDTNAV